VPHLSSAKSDAYPCPGWAEDTTAKIKHRFLKKAAEKYVLHEKGTFIDRKSI
jgi:hypothetical protein